MNYFHSVFVLFAMAVGLSSAPASAFDVRFKGFSSQRVAALEVAYLDAYRSILLCPYLAESYPWLKKRMLSLVENYQVTLAYAKDDANHPDECAGSHPGWISPSTAMTIREYGFDKACRGLKNLIFHEWVHMSWTFAASGDAGWGEEDDVSTIEDRCSEY